MIHFLGHVSFGAGPGPAAMVGAALAPLCGGPVRIERHGALVLASGAVRAGARPPDPILAIAPSGLVAGGAGRIVHDAALRARLGLKSARRDPGPILGAAWSRWGIEAPARLHGPYAAFVLDPASETLWLIRDETPAHPLFLVHRPGRFAAFANHPRALLALPGVETDLDPAAFAAAATLTAMDPTETPYRDLRRVPRAHVLAVTSKTRAAARWWTPSDRGAGARLSDEEYVRAARALFDAVVGETYGTGERVGILLSGGLDGLAVADSVRRQGLGPLTGYSVLDPPEACRWRRPGMIADQRPLVAAFQRAHPDVPVRIIAHATAPGDDAMLEQMRRMGTFCPAPHPSGLHEDARRAMLADGVTLALGGQGGNQTLSYAGWPRFDDLRVAGRWARLAWEIGCHVRRRGPRALRPLAGRAAPDWARRLWRALNGTGPGQDAGPRIATHLRPDIARALGARYGDASCLAFHGDGREERLAMVLRDHPYLDGGYLPWRMAGIALGMPFFDRRLIDFALSIPLDQFLRHGRTRWLMRRLLADRLPASIVDDERAGHDLSSFPVRAPVWRASLRAALPGLQASPLAGAIFDLDGMARIIETDWPATDRDPAGAFAAISDLGAAFLAARFAQTFDRPNQ